MTTTFKAITAGAASAVAFLLIGCGGATVPAPPLPSATTPGADAAAMMPLQDYEKVETELGRQFTALQESLSARQQSETTKHAEAVVISLGEAERFWAQRKNATAVKWAQDARELATQIAAAGTAGDLAKAGQAAADLDRRCTQCHDAYREADPAGGYRVKVTALGPAS